MYDIRRSHFGGSGAHCQVNIGTREEGRAISADPLLYVHERFLYQYQYTETDKEKFVRIIYDQC